MPVEIRDDGICTDLNIIADHNRLHCSDTHSAKSAVVTDLDLRSGRMSRNDTRMSNADQIGTEIRPEDAMIADPDLSTGLPEKNRSVPESATLPQLYPVKPAIEIHTGR